MSAGSLGRDNDRDRLEAHAFGAFLEHTSECMALTDARGVALFASASLERLLGVTPGFFTRRPLINVVARSDTRMFRAWLHELREAALGTTQMRSVHMRSRAGPVFMANISAARIVGPQTGSLFWRLHRASNEGRGA